MNPKHARLWAVAGLLLGLAVLWTNRNEYAACDVDGCVVINRWTGSLRFEPVDEQHAEPTRGGMIVERAPLAPPDDGLHAARIGR